MATRAVAHMFIYVYFNALLYYAYVLCARKSKKNAFVRITKLMLLLHNTVQHCTKHLAYAYIFENELFPTPADHERQHVDAVPCRACFSGPISVCLCCFANS